MDIDDIMVGYVKRARKSLSQSNSLKEDIELAKYIVNTYDGSVSDYIMEDLSSKEFFKECINYALDDTINALNPINYYSILVSAQKLNDHKINEIIYDIDEVEPLKDTGVEFIDVSEYQRRLYETAVFEIISYLSEYYNEQLLMFYESILEKTLKLLD